MGNINFDDNWTTYFPLPAMGKYQVSYLVLEVSLKTSDLKLTLHEEIIDFDYNKY